MAADEKIICDNDNVYIVNEAIVQNVYSVYLHDSIGKIADYRYLCHLLRNANQIDAFAIYLNNFGGYCHTGIDVINSMKACKSQIVTCLSGPLYSLAPLIALQGNKVWVEENTFMMFHDYSGGEIGKGNEMEAAINNDRRFLNDFFSRMTKKFLTPTEVKNVISGKDLYIEYGDIIKRLKRINKLANTK